MQEENNLFVNHSLTEAFKLYISNKDKKDSLDYNSFLCCVARMLIMIYGEEIVDMSTKNDEESFDNVLTRYGFDQEEVDNFEVMCEKYYMFNERQSTKAIKKKNKYFNLVQKYLIDMMVKRNAILPVDSTTLNDFYNMLFTANSSDFYRKSTAVLLAYNPYEIDEYAKKQGIIVG